MKYDFTFFVSVKGTTETKKEAAAIQKQAKSALKAIEVPGAKVTVKAG